MIKRYYSLCVLACGALLAPALSAHRRSITRELTGIKTPGGTSFVRDAEGTWTHPGFKKPGEKRENHVFKLDFDKDPTMGIPTLKDEKDEGVSLTVTYEQTEIDGDSPTETSKRYFNDYVGKHGTWKSRLCVGAAALGIGFIVYKNSDGVREKVDQALEKTTDFIKEVKEGKGNARSNALVGLGTAAGLGVVLHRYMTGKWILQS